MTLAIGSIASTAPTPFNEPEIVSKFDDEADKGHNSRGRQKSSWSDEIKSRVSRSISNMMSSIK